MPNNFLQVALITATTAFSLSAQVDRVPAGTEISVRTVEDIHARTPPDGRIYRGVVDRDVRDEEGRIVIPRGAGAELILRASSPREVLLDLESISVGGRRYTVNAEPESAVPNDERREGVGANSRTGKFVGGGAALGAIIGAIAGGGKGAAIGAAAGAGAGAAGQLATRGDHFEVPSESLLTFRLERPMIIGRPDDGYDRDGNHYHRYENPYRDERQH
jgi:hypothetical protein